MGESAEDRFLKKLVDYLNKRYENKYPEYRKPFFFFGKTGDERFAIQHESISRGAIWSVRTESGLYPVVEGIANGDIVVWSATAGKVPDVISLSCELDHIKYTSSRIEEIWEMIPDRENWGKLERKYKKMVAWLRNADRVAEEVTDKNGVKTVFFIPRPKAREGDRCYFVARFNSKGMSDEEKMEMIKKALDAVDEAQGRV